jgi:hypothetical protein
MLEDRDHMPYLTAIALESLRWRDVAPVGKSWLFSIVKLVVRKNDKVFQACHICQKRRTRIRDIESRQIR